MHAAEKYGLDYGSAGACLLNGMPQGYALPHWRRRSVLSSSLGEEGTLPAVHFFRSHILHVCGDAPLLAGRVSQLSVSVAPKHVLEGRIDPGAPVTARLKIVSASGTYRWIYMGLVTHCPGARHWGLAHRFVDEEDRVSNPKFRVHDFSVRSGHAPEFGGAKGRLVEFDGPRRVAANKIWRHGAVSFWDGFYLIWHGNLLFGFSGRGSAALKRAGSAGNRQADCATPRAAASIRSHVYSHGFHISSPLLNSFRSTVAWTRRV
jgi:hypothetical protein